MVPDLEITLTPRRKVSAKATCDLRSALKASAILSQRLQDAVPD